MRLTVNGKNIDFDKGSVLDLIIHYKLKPGGVAVEKNGALVKRDRFESEQLCEGDVIELVRFVGGG
jgi:thiamine biosynthesis protein ThiS